ncbi:MAG: class I SAM-dependent methyltransferase [Pseudomonadales bacterium]|nr:class I SAM-dependent methyltransferase [Pseudomonadales bacterium]MBO7004787.1 class I SAM-dependent methyltransferase [Pseudomonadales bacterium]
MLPICHVALVLEFSAQHQFFEKMNLKHSGNSLHEIYAQRDAHVGDKYKFFQADVRLHSAEKDFVVSDFLRQKYGGLVENLEVLDVGCGGGDTLVKFCDWGFEPTNLHGCDILESRINQAKKKLPDGVTITLGEPSDLAPEQYDLVTAFTVLSSVTDESMRQELAEQIWSKVKTGGWGLIFDFRVNNPRNRNVRKLLPEDLKRYWTNAESNTFFKTLCLAPPLARFICPISYRLGFTLSLLPFLRTHFVYAMQKTK